MQVVPSLYRGRASAPDLQFRRDSTRRAQDAVQDAQEEVKPLSFHTGNKPDFAIALKRSTYFDNDVVDGLLTIDSSSEFVIPKLTVALVCRLVLNESSAPGGKSSFTLYKSSKIIARDLFCEPGQLQLPLSFAVPSLEPASFDTKDCSVRWDVRLLQQSTGKRFTTVTRCVFRKACLYRELPGFAPKGQSERSFVLQKQKPLRLEAVVTKDVIAAREPVEVEVTLHNMGSILRAKKITASITQYAEAWVSSRAVYRRATVLDKSEHLPKRWSKGDVVDQGVGLGKAYLKKFALLPMPDASLKCAVQNIPSSDPAAESVAVLAPTAECQKKDGTLFVSIKYVIDITCHVFGADDMMVSLPVTIMSPQSDCALVPHTDDFLVFPPMEQPPTYHGLRRSSTASYGSLRHIIDESVVSLTHRSASLSLEPEPRSRDPNMTFPRRNSMGAVSRPLPAQWGAGPRPGADLDGARSVIDEMSDEDAEETLPAFDQEWTYEYMLRERRNGVGRSSV